MKQAVTRTRESFSSRIGDIVALTREVDEAALEDLETALLTSDIGVQTTNEILEALRDRARHQAIEGGAELRELLKEQLRGILEAPVTGGCGAGNAAEGDVSGGRERNRQRQPRRASWRPGIAGRVGQCCYARRTRFAQRRLSSLKCGPGAAAWR